MPRPRLRFTVRGLMIAVAVAAVAAVGHTANVILTKRSIVFRAKADWHAQCFATAIRILEDNAAYADDQARHNVQRGIGAWLNYHDSLENKYRRAARYPWLPVEPDPPEPE
jgi:hypothetical protein